MMKDEWEEAQSKGSFTKYFKVFQSPLPKGQIYLFPPLWDVWLGLALYSIDSKTYSFQKIPSVNQTL